MARMDAPGALAEGRWGEARRGFEQSIEELETADAYLGLAERAVVARRERAECRGLHPRLCAAPPGR